VITVLLEGYRLLDLTQGRPPGAACTHILADLGMEVIRIDPAEGPDAGWVRSGPALAWDSANRNKRSIALNLRTDEGKMILSKLVAKSDAVLEGARPGSAKRLGVDYDTLARLNPKLVYCSMSAFGQEGPYAELGAHDTEASAMRGAFGRADDTVFTPGNLGLLVTDVGAGLHAVAGILAGIIAASDRGEGCYIDLALADAINSFNLHHLQSVLMGSRVEVASHKDRAFLKCKDGKFIAQANVEPHNWTRFCQAVGLPEIEPLPTLSGPERELMIERLRAVMLTKTRDEWFEIISRSGATVGAVKELDELADDPQVKYRGLIWELDHPGEGRVRQWGSPIQVREHEATLRKWAPAPGEDTGAILAELGYGASEVETLRRSGVVRG
jgi:crotonobetainyl-CoA:carnitine CoA-transferase CaiB-like acyl-CoA transferase